MLYYNQKLVVNAQHLRRNLTDAERLLWFRLRRKQLCGVQFYRQKPIGNFIVDFYAPSVKLVIEVDGGQHFEVKHQARDKERERCLEALGLRVLRFDNLQVLRAIDGVVEAIWTEVTVRASFTVSPLNTF
jgi:very-short-patch-repair endonuclease